MSLVLLGAYITHNIARYLIIHTLKYLLTKSWLILCYGVSLGIPVVALAQLNVSFLPCNSSLVESYRESLLSHGIRGVCALTKTRSKMNRSKKTFWHTRKRPHSLHYSRRHKVKFNHCGHQDTPVELRWQTLRRYYPQL
mgnify:CR=1 FL=1